VWRVLWLLALCGCSATGSRPGDSPVPCEMIIAIWSYIACPDAPQLDQRMRPH
jgi:hypothetical protein